MPGNLFVALIGSSSHKSISLFVAKETVYQWQRVPIARKPPGGFDSSCRKLEQLDCFFVRLPFTSFGKIKKYDLNLTQSFLLCAMS